MRLTKARVTLKLMEPNYSFIQFIPDITDAERPRRFHYYILIKIKNTTIKGLDNCFFMQSYIGKYVVVFVVVVF